MSDRVDGISVPKLTRAFPKKELKQLNRDLFESFQLDNHPHALTYGLDAAMQLFERVIAHGPSEAAVAWKKCMHVQSFYRYIEHLHELAALEDSKQRSREMQKMERKASGTSKKRADDLVSKLLQKVRR